MSVPQQPSPPAYAYSETTRLIPQPLSKVTQPRITLRFLGVLVLSTLPFLAVNTVLYNQYNHICSELHIKETQLNATRTELASVCAQHDEAEELDAARRKRMNLLWGKPQPADHCAGYGAREYSARLFNIEDGYNWTTACLRTPVAVHDNVIMKPDWCHVRDGVWGHWIVPFNEPNCEADWGEEVNVGCVQERPGLRQIEARINSVHSNENSYLLCTTAPRTVRNVHFDKPNHCYDRDHFMWAVWEVKDTSCH